MDKEKKQHIHNHLVAAVRLDVSSSILTWQMAYATHGDTAFLMFLCRDFSPLSFSETIYVHLACPLVRPTSYLLPLTAKPLPCGT